MAKNVRTSTRRHISPQFIKRLSSWLVLSTGLTLAATATAKAASYYWDSDGNPSGNDISGAGLGNTNTPFVWDTTTPLLNWWDGISADVGWTNSFANTAVFTGTAGTVTLNNPISAGGLAFNVGGYTITGDTLALGGDAVINVANAGDRETISSVIAGTDGLTKIGYGTLVLANNANSFSGDVVINNGSIVITNPGQLGTGVSAISINGLANTGSPGYSGGQLVLQGAGTGAGITINREISVAGRGPGAANSAGGLLTIGNNTIAGNLVVGSTGSEGRVVAAYGITTITGGVMLGSGNGSLFQGNGNWVISGIVTGFDTAQDRFAKSGNTISTTLWLQNSNNQYAQTTRIDAGTVRVSDNGALGTNTTVRSVDLNGGTLEIDSDTPNFATRNIYSRANTNGVFLNRALGGSGLNQAVAFNFFDADNATFTLSGRDGYSFSINGSTGAGTNMSWAGGGNLVITNNLNGTATLNMNIQHDSETSARTITFQGNGETVLTGAFLANGSSNPNVIKTGPGQLTLTNTATASTNTGTTTISQGTLSFASVNALPTGAINIGNATTTSGTLNYIGAGDTLSQNILLNTTTANAYINANGTGALVINGNILTTVNGAKTLVLGGASTAANEIRSLIGDSTGVTNLQKIGSGTWILSGADTFGTVGAGTITLSAGTLGIKDTYSGGSRNVIQDSVGIVLNADTFAQTAGGTLAYLGDGANASSETVGALTATAGAGTIQVVPGTGGTATLTFGSLGARTAGASVNVLNTGTVVINGTAGFLNAGTYFNGSDFAYSDAGTLRAPVYDTDAGFVTAGAALTAASHNLVAADTTSGAVTISSLKISGSHTVNQTGLLTIQTGANSAGGIIQTGGSSIISGTGVTTGGTGDLVIRVDGISDTLTMAAPITSTTTGGLTKTGSGLLVLQGTQSYTGATTINEGGVQVGTGSSLGGGAASNSNALVIRQDGSLDINGNNIGVGAFNGAGTVTNSSGTLSTFTVGNGNGVGYFTGSVTGKLGLTKTGTGAVSLTGTNTFTGPVTISGGTLAVTSLANIGQASGIGTGDATNAATNAASLVFNGGTLQYTGANTTIFQVTQTPSVSIDRLFTLAANGAIDSSGTFGNNVLATAVQNNAALILNNTGDVAFSGTGTRTLTLTGTSTGDNELDVHLINNTNGGGALSVTKSGNGLWLLNPAAPNTYTGTTTISAGQLQAVDGVGLSSQSNLVLGGGVFQTSGTFTRGLTGGGNVQWSSNGSGGFSASYSKLTVNLGGSGAQVQWGTGGIGNGTGTLILSSATAFADTEFVNPIDLNVTSGTTTRTIQVDDNGNTGLDFATVSGVISNSGAGTAALTKSGSGTLILGDANTYNGNTTITAGSLVVTSIGASGATATSVGSNTSGSKLLIGNGTTGGANLLYVGQGETTTRNITLNTTTATVQIDSSGSGALVLTSITNGAAGSKTLTLRGSNTDGNMITSVLADNSGALNVTKSDGGLWILNPSAPNTLTGVITASGGVLGLTANGIGSAASVNFSNGEIIAYGGDLTTSTPVNLVNNSTAVFGGTNNITLNGTITKLAGANDQTISNNLDNGAILTINGAFVDAETGTNATRTINIRGYGSTVWNGLIQNSTSVPTNIIKLDIRLANNASLTLSGSNTFTGGLLLTQGTLIINNLAAIPSANTLTFDGGVLTSNFDLSGANKLTNPILLQDNPFAVAGSNNIEFSGSVTLNGNRSLINNLDSGKTLTLSGTITNSAAATLTLFGSGNTVIPGVIGTGSGAQALQYSGSGTLSLTGTNTMAGALTAAHGTIKLSGTNGGSVNAASSVTINQGATVTLDNSGGNNPAGRIAGRAVTLNGGTLNFIGNGTSTTETAGVLTVNSIMAPIVMTGGGTNTLTFSSVSFANTGSSLDLTGITGLGSSNFLKFTTAPALLPASAGILNRAVVTGDFATYSSANGVVAFSAYNNSNNLDTAAATDTMNVTANAALGPNRTLNALKINGSGLTVSGDNKTLLLTAGSVLNTGGDNTLSISTVNMNGQSGLMQVDGSSTLTMLSSLINGGINKVGTGTLDLRSLTYYGSTTNVSTGSLVLDGGLNTLFPASQPLNVGLGATVDLAGNAQYVGQLTSPGTTPNTGGTITTSTGTGTLVANYTPGSSTFSGQITGSVNFGRVGGNTLTLESAQTYNGATVLMGGTTTLQDDGTLLNTSSIDLNAATLLLQNNANLQTSNTDRVGDTIPITLRGGTISFNGRVDDASSEKFGALFSTQGANTVTATTGGAGGGNTGAFFSADVTFASLTRTVGTTVNFTGSTAQGSIGNQPRIFFTAAPTTYFGGVLGPWAIANSTDYAAYNATNGVGTVGNGGFAGYESTFASGNITDIGTISTAPLSTTLPAGTTTTAMLRLSGNFTNNLYFANNNDVLNLQLGGILRSNNAFDTTIGTTLKRGIITAGGTEASGVRELVIYNNATGNPTFGGATTVAGSPVVTMSSTIGLQPGMTVTNGNFPAGTTILSVDSFTQVTLSQNSGAGATSQTLTAGSFVNGVTNLGSPVVTMNSTVGVAPGMTITGTGIPAGTYVVSVDSPTQLTLSQNSTAVGSSLSFTIGVSNMIVNSVIADNGFGNSVQFVKSGGGVLNLSANNTYTGGTVIDQGTVNLIGSGVVIPAGGVTLNNATMVMNTNAGQIDSSNAINIRQGSSLTLTGNNTLDSLSFDNNGGTATPTVTTGGVLTLTNSTPITLTSSNPLTLPVIGGSLDIGSGLKTFNIGAIQVAGKTVLSTSPALNISAAILSPGASIHKTGDGLLELSGGSTFGGGLTISGGGLVIGGTNSTPVQGGGGLAGGPLGTGSVDMAAGTVLLIDNASRTVGNDFTFEGTPLFDNTGTSAATMTLNGAIHGLPNGAVTMNVASPFLTVALLGQIPNIANITNFTRTGLGTLQFNSTGYTGNFNVGQLSANNAISIFNDGNGRGDVETVNLGSVIFDSGVIPTITIGRAGGTLPFAAAVNKILAPASINNLTLGLSVTNNNGYGLQVPDAITLPAGNTTFTVANATNSNVVQGLYLSGKISGGGTLAKSGNGTLVLTNTSNDFVGNIAVNQGVLSVDDVRELGNAANMVSLNPSSGTATFRATDDITTSLVIQLASTANTRAIEVVGGKTLELDAPFDLNAGAGKTASLTKNDNGVLILAADNVTGQGWAGGIIINAGAILVENSKALGTGTVTVGTAGGAALQLTGGVTISNSLTATTTPTGINSGGAIESVSGTNTYSGVISQPSGVAMTIGADAGSTLNITGGVSSAGSNSITFAGAGNINVTTAGMNNGSSFNKIGSGTLTITVANPNLAASQTIADTAGAIVLAGAGTLGPTTNSTGAITVDVGATLTLDNRAASGGNVNNRLGTTRPITFRGGNFNLFGNETTATTETFAAPTLSRGLTVITVTDGGAGTNLVFTSPANVPANAQNNGTAPTGVSILFRGTNLGNAAGPGVATIKDIGTSSSNNGFAFNGQTGAAGTKNKGIMPYAIIDDSATGNGVSFATGDGTSFTTSNIRKLADNEYETANTITANDNILLNGGVTTNIATGLTVNSFTIDASANLTMGNGVLTTISSGGILVRGGSTSTISGGALNQPNTSSPLNIWTIGDLTISSVINGGNGTANGNIGFVKAGAGTLTLSEPTSTIPGLAGMGVNTMSGQLVINQGTLKLNGGKNTIQANNFVALDGGTLDLNGNSQQILGLIADGAVAGAGGTITSSTGTGNLIVSEDNVARSFAGTITGNVNFTRSGQNNWTLYSNQSYVGSTVINGGVTILRDSAALSNTSKIDLNYATLQIDNNAGTIDMADRVNNSAPITLRGGTITFQGRAATASSETLGDITLAEGNSIIGSVIGGTGINSADLTLTSLTRLVGGGTINFTATTGGLIGSSSRILIPTINGVSTDTYGSVLTNDILGGWAIINTSDFASYVPGLGVGAIGQQGFAQYSGKILSSAGAPTDNIRVNYTAASTISDDATINSVKFDNVVLGGVSLADGKTLTLASGGFLNFTSTPWNFGTVPNQGFLTSGGPELFIYTQGNGTPTINSVIKGAGMSVIKSGANTAIFAGLNTYDGGTFVNQGTLNVAATGYIPLAANPANGLVISNATVTLLAPGLIDPGNIVTINGGGVLNLFGDNTVAGLVFNNDGGTGNPSVLSYSVLASNGGPNAGAAGVLTIGSAGIVATSSNVGTTSNLFGRVDFGASANTVTVDTINVNGVTDVAPLQAAFALQGVINSSGGITKLGNGVLGLNAQQIFTGGLHVAVGGVRIGAANGGSRFSRLTLDAGTRLDLAGQSTTLGSLAGSGTVFSSSSAQTLTVGYDNTDSTFSGSFSRFNDAIPNAVGLTKIGTGTLTLTSAQSGTTGSSGNITVNGGGLTYAGAGQPFPSVPTATAPTSAITVNVNTGGTLTLDNESAGNVNSRLAMDHGAGTLAIQGGDFVLLGNSSTNTQETVNSVLIQNGGGTMTLVADPASQLNMIISTLGGGNSTGSMVVRGLSPTAGNGKATLTITTPSLLGSQGSGTNGTTTMAIRADTLGDASLTGKGTGYLVKDSASGFWRPLAASELQTSVAAWAATQNAGLSSAQTIVANTSVNSLTISGTARISSGLNPSLYGAFGPTGYLTMNLSGATTLLVLDGATADIDTALAAASGGITPYLHVVGSGVLNVNGYFGIGGTVGMVKADDGVLNLNNRAFYTGGNTTVNGGTLNLNSGGDNTLAVVPGATTPTVTPLNINGVGAVVDLKNFNQAVGALTTVNPIPGQGGTVTNSGPNVVTLTSTGGGAFSGPLTGNLAFTRAGNNTTLLTNTNTYTGPTTVRGGTLQLRDSGALTGTSAINLDYGTLNIDNSGLSSLANLNIARIPATAPVTMQGGTLTVNGGGSIDTSVLINSLTVTGGNNSINVLPQINEGSTVEITIGSLVRDPNNHSMVNFNGFSQNNSSGSSSTGGQGLSANGNIILNSVNGVTPLNLAIAGAVTTAGSNVVMVGSTAQLVVGAAVTGTGLPANEFITSIIDGTHFTITTGAGVTAQSSTTVTAKNLTNNLIGGWAVADGNSFATYVTGFGVSVMGQTTQGIAAPAFDGSDITAATTATQNISDANSGTTRTITANRAANSWRLVPGATETVTLGGGVGITLGVGIITNANVAISIAGTNNTSTITTATPGSDFYIYTNQNTTSIGAKFTGDMSLVKSGGATLTLNNPTAVGSNDYTGGTYVQAGTMNLTAGAAGIVLIPGDLTINNATVTMNTNAGQIASTSNIFINGGGVLNMVGTNTLAGVTFDNQGGTGNPTLAGSTSLTLSATNAITANNDSLATTPVISGTALILSDTAPVITTTGLSPNDLNITAIITSAGGMITKMGTGSLTLSGANTFGTGFDLAQGSLIFGVSTTGTLPAVTNGPVGTGTLTIEDGTTVLSDSNRVVGNPTTVKGDFTFGGVTSTNNLTFSGAMNLGAVGRTINVSSPAVTGTISGAITSTAAGTALTKVGPGALVLASSANNFGAAGIVVAEGILKNGVANAIPNTTPVTINPQTEYDLGGFGEAILVPWNNNGIITNSGAVAALSIGGTSATDTTTIQNSAINTGVLTGNNFTLSKVGAGTLTINTTGNTYGFTQIISGKLAVGVDNALPTTGAVTIGTAATTGTTTATLDLTNANQTIGSLTASSTVGTASANILIGAGKTLTVAGAVTIGTTGTSTTNLNVVGSSGTFSIGTSLVPTNANVQIGNNATTNVSNGATVDLSGLGTFTANLGTGIFRVGDPTNAGGTATLGSTLILAANNTITATTFTSDSPDSAVTETVKLGSGSNVFDVNTFEVGASATGRSNGSLVFNGGTGTFTLRSLTDPINGRATFNVANVTFGTGANPTATANLLGHSVDLRIGTMTVASRSALTGTATGTFSYDTGILDANDLLVGNIAAASTTTGTTAGTVNLAGGTSTFNTVTNPIQIGVDASTTTGSTASGTLNISGTAAVTVAANNGVSIRLGQASTAGVTATGVLNITGGSLTVAGDIVRGAATGTSNTTLTLNGGTLDMSGHNIGSATGTVGSGTGALNLQSGTLKNVGQINNGAAITKTTSGTLTIAGTNTYTGNTNVNQGTVVVSGSITGNVNVASGATLASGTNFTSQVAAISAASDALGGGTVAPGNTGGVADLSTIGQLNATGAVSLGTASTAGVAHLSIEIGGTNDGTTGGDTQGPLQYDRLAMSGSTLSLTNANLDISPVNGYVYTNATDNPVTQQVNLDSHIFFLITGATSVVGTFANQLPIGSEPKLPGFATIFGTNGQEFAISYTANFATNSFTGGNDVAIMAIPEPNSLSMLAGSLGVALGLQRIRRRRKA